MINNLFPTPIYSNTIDSDTLKKLQTDINDYIKNNRNEFNLKAWNCNTETNILCEEEKSFFPKYLKDLIIQNTVSYFSQAGFKLSPFFISGCWLTLGGKGAFQDLHDHLDSTTQRDVFSGVMYISIDENSGGEFIIQSPIDTLVNLLPHSGIESKSERPEYNKSNTAKYKPRVLMNAKEGMFISYPSWLKHGSLDYRSDKKKRISISWNITLLDNITFDSTNALLTNPTNQMI